MEKGANAKRGRHLDDLAEALPQRAYTLSRLFLSRTEIAISLTEGNVLAALSEGPHRITDLAAREGVTQPAMTLLVNRLEKRGWAARQTDPGDGRAVLVALTDDGRATVERLRAEYRALLHDEMATLPDDDVETLARAVEILDDLVQRLGGGAG